MGLGKIAGISRGNEKNSDLSSGGGGAQILGSGGTPEKRQETCQLSSYTELIISPADERLTHMAFVLKIHSPIDVKEYFS